MLCFSVLKIKCSLNFASANVMFSTKHHQEKQEENWKSVTYIQHQFASLSLKLHIFFVPVFITTLKFIFRRGIETQRTEFWSRPCCCCMRGILKSDIAWCKWNQNVAQSLRTKLKRKQPQKFHYNVASWLSARSFARLQHCKSGFLPLMQSSFQISTLLLESRIFAISVQRRAQECVLL